MFNPVKDAKTTYQIIISDELKTPPKVLISYTALAKMKQYVMQCDKEIGWLAFVEHDKEDTYTITDTILLKQNVTSTTTEIDEAFMNDYATQLILQNKLSDLDKIKCWGHSHVDMQVCPSGTDDKTFEEYYTKCDFFIRIIANKKGDLRLDIAEPKKKLIFYNVKWEAILPDEYKDINEEYENTLCKLEELDKKLDNYNNTYITKFADSIKSEIKDKVREEKVITYPKSYGKNKDYSSYKAYDFDSYYDDYYDDYYSNYKPLDTQFVQTIVINKNTANKTTKAIDDVLDYATIEDIAVAGTEANAKYVLKKRKEFKGYTWHDWKDLVDACTAYCTDYYEGALL